MTIIEYIANAMLNRWYIKQDVDKFICIYLQDTNYNLEGLNFYVAILRYGTYDLNNGTNYRLSLSDIMEYSPADESNLPSNLVTALAKKSLVGIK